VTKLKNKRLSQSNRSHLTRFANQQVRATQDTTDLDAAYEAAAKVVAVACEAKFPKRDMKVLAEYKMARPDSCVYVSCGGHGDYNRFEYREGDKRVPLRPSRSCYNQPLLLDGADADAVNTFFAAKEVHEKLVADRIADFETLIQNATTFNALSDVWPAIEALRSEIVGSSAALSLMSDDVLARIKADPALSAQVQS
jgi:hypothetical protein